MNQGDIIERSFDISELWASETDPARERNETAFAAFSGAFDAAGQLTWTLEAVEVEEAPGVYAVHKREHIRDMLGWNFIAGLEASPANRFAND